MYGRYGTIQHFATPFLPSSDCPPGKLVVGELHNLTFSQRKCHPSIASRVEGKQATIHTPPHLLQPCRPTHPKHTRHNEVHSRRSLPLGCLSFGLCSRRPSSCDFGRCSSGVSVRMLLYGGGLSLGCYGMVPYHHIMLVRCNHSSWSLVGPSIAGR